MKALPGICLTMYSVIVMKIYMDTFLEKRRAKGGAIGWMLFILWQTVLNIRVWEMGVEGIMNEGHPGVNVLLSLLTMEAVGVCAYEGKLWKRLVFPVIYGALWMMSEGLYLFGVGYLSKGEPSIIICVLVSHIIILLMTLGINRFAHKKRIGKPPYGVGSILVLFSISEIILYYAIYMMAREAGTGKTNIMLWLSISALMLLALDLCAYPIYGKMVEMVWMKKRSGEYLRQMELFKNQWELERNAREEIRKIKHDLKQNLIYFKNLLKHHEYEKMQETLSKLLMEVEVKSGLEGRTDILAVDSLLNHLGQEARRKGICLHVNAELSEAPEIEDTDFCVLMGNVFDNAVEASEKLVQDREIWVELHYKKGCLLFRVSNRYDGKAKKGEQGRRISTKEGAHGLGLRSVERIAEKYQGHMEIKEEQDVFRIEILLYG